MSKKVYTLNTKKEAIKMRNKGYSVPYIQKNLKITHRSSIYLWHHWDQTGQPHRLSTGIGRPLKPKPPLTERYQTEQDFFQQALSQREKPPFQEIFALIEQFQDKIPVIQMLNHLQVSKSWFYQQKRTQEKKTAQEKLYELQVIRIKELCERENYMYGYRKIRHLYQKEHQTTIPERRVKQIMRANNLKCRIYPKKKFCYYRENKGPIPNIIQRMFDAQRPLEKLFTDVMVQKTKNGLVYFSAIIDAYNSQIVACYTSRRQNTELLINTFKQLPALKAPCIIHHDQGVIYRSHKFQKYLKKKGFTTSMSAKASPEDNGIIESFFGRLRALLKLTIPNLASLPARANMRYLKQFSRFWNSEHILTRLNYMTPLQFLKASPFEYHDYIK